MSPIAVFCVVMAMAAAGAALAMWIVQRLIDKAFDAELLAIEAKANEPDTIEDRARISGAGSTIQTSEGDYEP